jgi:hypothetical protein
MFFVFSFFMQLCETLSVLRRRRKTDHSWENKTHEKLTVRNLFGITLPVTKVTVFETSEGIGERSREALGESNSRAV